MAMFAPLAAAAVEAVEGTAAAAEGGSLLSRVTGGLLSNLQFGGGKSKEAAPQGDRDAPAQPTGLAKS